MTQLQSRLASALFAPPIHQSIHTSISRIHSGAADAHPPIRSHPRFYSRKTRLISLFLLIQPPSCARPLLPWKSPFSLCSDYLSSHYLPPAAPPSVSSTEGPQSVPSAPFCSSINAHGPLSFAAQYISYFTAGASV